MPSSGVIDSADCDAGVGEIVGGFENRYCVGYKMFEVATISWCLCSVN